MHSAARTKNMPCYLVVLYRQIFCIQVHLIPDSNQIAAFVASMITITCDRDIFHRGFHDTGQQNRLVPSMLVFNSLFLIVTSVRQTSLPFTERMILSALKF